MQAFRVVDAPACRTERAPTSLRFLALFLAAGSLVFAACGDDGKLLGSDGAAGSSGQANGGSHAGSSGHAGTLTNAGATSAGANSGGATNAGANSGGATNAGANSGGATSAGANSGGASSAGANSGGAACATPEGCAGGGGQGGGGEANLGCVGTTCNVGQTCVAYRTVGGALFPPDAAGNCMTGRHVENNRCQPDFAYTCAELSGCSAPATTCHCMANTACANDGACRLPTAATWLDPSADLVCEQLAP